jgi:hypothetical protein
MGHKKHRTKTNKTIKHDITLKTKMMSNTDPTKNRGGTRYVAKSGHHGRVQMVIMMFLQLSTKFLADQNTHSI